MVADMLDLSTYKFVIFYRSCVLGSGFRGSEVSAFAGLWRDRQGLQIDPER